MSFEKQETENVLNTVFIKDISKMILDKIPLTFEQKIILKLREEIKKDFNRVKGIKEKKLKKEKVEKVKETKKEKEHRISETRRITEEFRNSREYKVHMWETYKIYYKDFDVRTEEEKTN
jgi:hypothetical protein